MVNLFCLRYREVNQLKVTRVTVPESTRIGLKAFKSNIGPWIIKEIVKTTHQDYH